MTWVEMILSGDKTLEAIVREELQAEKEIRTAIDSLREEAFEDISPIIEQQLDPESYESTSYSIETDYGSASYDTGRNYYDLIIGDDGAIGASMTAVYSEHYHELLQDVQEIASSTRACEEGHHPFIEPQVDFNTREKKNSVKLVSVAVWQAMYDGKLIFN